MTEFRKIIDINPWGISQKHIGKAEIIPAIYKQPTAMLFNKILDTQINAYNIHQAIEKSLNDDTTKLYYIKKYQSSPEVLNALYSICHERG